MSRTWRGAGRPDYNGHHSAQPRNRGGCTTGKRRFRSADAAKTEIERAAQSGHNHIPTRTYLCPICAGWHLSSHPPRTR